VSAETQVVAKVTYQSLFRLFPKLSGMSGTAFTEAKELLEVYGLKVSDAVHLGECIRTRICAYT
jgi:preprotein translocase subunit SecA